MRLAIFVVASILLMIVDHHRNHLETLRQGLAVVLYPLQFAVHAPFRGGRWMVENLATRQELLRENHSLKEQHLVTQGRMSRFEALEAENARLRNLLDSSPRIAERVLVAEVISVEMDPFAQRILLNKGSSSGVHEGQALIDAQGVMGQVVSVNPVSSSALLITDPSHALPIQINRNGLRAVAVGLGVSNTLELLHLPTNADLRVGDLVVTSGLGRRFPGGYPVGQVTQVTVDAGRPFASIVVRPSASLERNREVLLVWPGETLEEKPGEQLVGPPAEAGR